MKVIEKMQGKIIVILIEDIFDYRTGSRRHCTLKSQFLLVNFYFVLHQFQIKIARFSLVFTIYILFCAQILVLFLVLAAKCFSLT